MKLKKTISALACSGAILFGLRGFALPEEAGETFAEKPQSSECSAEVRGKLDRAAAKVRASLHRSSMLEASDDPAENAEIEELHHSGWIIKATVEEVEAALQAAALTPTEEDDVAARILAHRASCRYYLEYK